MTKKNKKISAKRSTAVAEPPAVLPTEGLLYRSAELQLVRADGEKKNVVRVIASTSEPVEMYSGYFESLQHGADNVDVTAAKTALLNHDRNQIIGGIKSLELDGQKLVAELEIDESAVAGSGVKILDAVRRGYLKGVSIGYHYDLERDCKVVTENEKTVVTVNRWSLREISLTPCQADVAAQVLRGRRELAEAIALIERAETMAKQTDANAVVPAAPDATNAVPPVDVDAERTLAAEKARKEAKEIAEMARSLDLDAADFVGCRSVEEASRAMLKRVAENCAAKVNPKEPVVVEITRDAGDKADEAAEDGILALGGIKEGESKGMRGKSILDIGRCWLATRGVDALHMDKRSLAAMLLGKQNGRERGANVTAGMFTSFVLVNAMDKAVLQAFRSFAGKTTYQIWTKEREVEDFKTFYGAGLSSGNLKKTIEDTPFEGLSKGEGGYSSALDMWGATLSLTLQALVNDDLGEFMSLLGRAGAIAQRTIDKEVYTQLAAATWTNRTFTSGDLDVGTLAKAEQNLMDTTGPEDDAEKLLVSGRFLIVPTGLRQTALQLLAASTPNVAPGSRYFFDHLQPVVTPFLATAGTPAQSTWYLSGDQLFEPAVVALLRGMNTPQIEEYDAGAVAARKWKVYLPFKVVITPTYGIYRATNA